jgi:homoserine/homoserine lactone efflux protein
MALDLYLTFLGACMLLFLKPGPAMSVIVANSVEYRVNGGLITVAGNALGIVILIVVATLGLGWIAAAMRDWFATIRIVGALYLLWLGVSRLRNAGAEVDYQSNPAGQMFRAGFISAIANPEVILFLAAFLPPFIDERRPVPPQLAILGVSFVLLSGATGILLAVAAGQARRFLSGRRLRYIDYASGALIIVASLWLAWPRS